MSARDVEIANVICQQMGGIGRIKMFTGAKNFGAIKNGVCFTFPQRKRSLPNCVRITLNATDTYDVEFARFTNGRLDKKTFEFIEPKNVTINKYEGIYCDQLVELFEENTQLYLHF